jgi:hypothetical protein
LKKDYFENLLAEEIKYESSIMILKNSELLNLKSEHEIKLTEKKQTEKCFSTRHSRNGITISKKKSLKNFDDNKNEVNTFVTDADFKMN